MKKINLLKFNIMYLKNKFLVFLLSIFFVIGCEENNLDIESNENQIEVIAYYPGGKDLINQYDLNGVTQLIYSFLHLKGNKLAVDNKEDSLTVVHLSNLKSKYPKLKVLVALGGWGGCKTCSDVFSSDEGREEFAISTARILKDYNLDGIDLDWEYPVIPGVPGHKYQDEDKDNFTDLIVKLDNHLDSKHIISFAAGGFDSFLEKSIDWNKVMPLVDHVNIMSYDLYSQTTTGHHTPLYSINKDSYSADSAVRYLTQIGVPRNKIVIGAAFYGRIWENVIDTNNGLSQDAKFRSAISFDNLNSLDKGFEFYWDENAMAPYGFNKTKNEFLSFDNTRSVSLKTKYAIDQDLKGIMFWQLGHDLPKDGLLDAIKNEVYNKD